MSMLIMLHSWLRWVVVIAMVVLFVKSLVGWLGKQEYTTLDRQFTLAYSLSLSLQVVLGLVILVWLMVVGAVQGYHGEHAIIMIITLIVGMRYTKWKDKPDVERFRNMAILLLIVGALIFVGVWRLPQGWLG